MFASGDEGLLLRSCDGAWTVVPTGVKANLDGLWGTSIRDAFAVADSDGTILHHDAARNRPRRDQLAEHRNPALCRRRAHSSYRQ